MLEYKTINDSRPDVLEMNLNAYAAEGWRFVAKVPDGYLLERSRAAVPTAPNIAPLSYPIIN